MLNRPQLQPSPRHRAKRPLRQRRWPRWAAGSVLVLVAAIWLATWAFIRFQPVLAPLGLPTGHLSAPAGPLDGRWQVVAGSAAGFRVRETALGVSNDTVGRTGSVSGVVAISGNRIVTASFRVDLATLTVNGKPSAQVASSLQTSQHPDATVQVTGPVPLPAGFAAGQRVTMPVSGQLSLDGMAHTVRFSLSARRDGQRVEAAGQIPVTLAAWDITPPAGFGFLGSLADHGVAEFLLILRQP